MPLQPAFLRSPGFRALAGAQRQVLSRAQLAEHGAGRQLIVRRVDAELWQTLGPHVVVLQRGPLSRAQQYWAGVLHAGPGSALGGLTALEAAGFTGFTSYDVTVTAPHGSARRDLVDPAVVVRVFETRHLPGRDVLAQHAPPRVRQDRAALDAAATARSDLACRTLLAAAVQQRLVTAARLRQLVGHRPALRRRALILETLDDIEGGSQSLPELEYLRGLRRYGLPRPTRQRLVAGAGQRYYLDADFDEWLVTAEINGAQHLTLQQKERDDLRRTRLAIGGRLVVDIGSHTVRHDIALAVLLTADALRSRGWVPARGVRRRLDALAAGREPPFGWTSHSAA